jgi:hypothetical protein
MSKDVNDFDDNGTKSTDILDQLLREPTTDRRSFFIGLLITAIGALFVVAKLIHIVTISREDSP